MNAGTSAHLERMRREPTLHIATEIGKGREHGTIHEITLPPFLSPEHYVQGLSIQAFRYGKRKGASKEDARAHRDRCCWGPTCLYHVKSLAEWEEDVEANQKAWAETRKKFPSLPEQIDPRSQPRTKHASVWDFYKHIGFDHKLRGYRDKDGQEIRYSTLPEAKDKAKTEAQGPEL